MLSEKMPQAVTRIGFMNINKPSIKDGLESFKGTGVKKIVVFPLFLAKGVHTTEDVPGLIGLKEGKSAYRITATTSYTRTRWAPTI